MPVMAFCGLMLGAPAHADGLVVRFVPERDYGPFVYSDADGSIRGLSVDILNEVARLADLRLETMPARGLDESLLLLKNGGADLVSSLRPTPERGQYLGFTEPYVSVPAVLVTNSRAVAYASLEDMAGKAVAVGNSYAVEAFVRQHFPAVHWVSVSDDMEGLRRLASGAVSGVVADAASARFAATRLGLGGLHQYGGIGFEYALSFAYRKDDPELGAALEQGLRLLSPAQRQAILRRWLDGDVVVPADPRRHLVLWSGLVLACMSALLFVILVFRRRQARRQ